MKILCKKAISIILILLLLVPTVLFLASDVSNANGDIYYWRKYTCNINTSLSRDGWSGHGFWGGNSSDSLWSSEIDGNGEIILTKTNMPSNSYILYNEFGYRDRTTIGLYAITNEMELAKQYGFTYRFPTSYRFNYSKALREAKRVNLEYWSYLYLAYRYDTDEIDPAISAYSNTYDYSSSKPIYYQLTIRKSYTKKDYLGVISSTNRNQYPDNNVDVKDEFWYEFVEANNINTSWNQHKGNAKNTGQIFAKGPDVPALLWKFTFEDNDIVERSSPVVDNQGNVYVGTIKGYLYSIDKEGNLNWKYNIGSKIETTPAVSNDTIYLSNKGILYAINYNGTLKWSKSINTNPSKYPSSPTISNDGTIYVATISSSNYGSLYAFNPDGSMKWNSQTYRDYGRDSYASTPAIGDDGTIYYFGSEKELYCMNPLNGGNRWSISIFGSYTVSGSPAIGTNGNINIMEDWGRIYSYTNQGRLSWNYVTGELLLRNSLNIGLDGSIFTNDFYTIYSLNADGTVRWTYKVPRPTLADPIYMYTDTILDSENTQYIGTKYGALLALKSNGTEKWWYDIGEEIRSTAAMDSKGVLYIPTFEGSLYAIADKSIVNQPPVISISKPVVNQYFGSEDLVQVQGITKDENKGDILSIKYSIKDSADSSNKTVTLTSPAQIISNGQNQSFQGNITLNNLDSGNYILQVWAEDNKKAKSNVVEIPIVIFNTLRNIENSMFLYLQKEDVPQFFIVNSDSNITKNGVNDNIMSEIKNHLSIKDIFMYFIGKGGTTESYIKSNLTGNYSTNTTFTIKKATDFIKNSIGDIESTASNIFTTDEFIWYSMLFEDYEKDYKNISLTDKVKLNNQLPEDIKKPKELKAQYTHEPNIFENPVSKHSKSTNAWRTISGIEDPYMISQAKSDMRGEWTLELQASDDTKNLKYDKYSDIKTYQFIIHEKPKAIIESWAETTTTHVNLTGENSFDLDFKSRENKGIVKYEWQYQLEDGTWINYAGNSKRITITRNLGGKKVINYALTVTDCYNATDTTIVPAPPLMEPEPIIIVPNNIYTGPYGSDTLTISNDSEPKSRIRAYQYIFDFKSINNYINMTQNTVVNAPSYTFAKNTLRYAASKNPFTRSVTLKLTIDTGAIKEAIKPIIFTPVVIDKLDMTTISENTINFKADIINSTPSDHRVIATIKGIDYEMNYINGTRWEQNLNISGADKIYIRVEKRVNNSIVYDKGEVVANRPPTVSINVSPSIIYEGDTAKVSIIANDPDLDKLGLAVKHRINGGTWSTIWTKDNVDSGVEQNFNIHNVAAGNNELMVIATDSFGATGTDSTNFEVLQIKIEAELLPQPALAGDELIFTITTEGYVERIEIVVPNDMKAKDNVPGKFNRSGKYSYPLGLDVNSSRNIKTDTIKYITSVEIDKTLTTDSKRLREPYVFIVRAIKNDIIKEVELTLDVRRSVLDLVKPGIYYKGSTSE